MTVRRLGGATTIGLVAEDMRPPTIGRGSLYLLYLPPIFMVGGIFLVLFRST